MLGGWCSDGGRFVPHFLIGERSLPLTHPSSGGSACPTLRRCARWRSSGRTGLRSCGSWWTCSSLPLGATHSGHAFLFLHFGDVLLQLRPDHVVEAYAYGLMEHAIFSELWDVQRGRSRGESQVVVVRVPAVSLLVVEVGLPFVLPGGDDDVVGNADDEVQPTSDILFTPKHLNSTTTTNSRMLAKLWLRLISNFILMRNSFRGPENNHGQYVDICFVVKEAQKQPKCFSLAAQINLNFFVTIIDTPIIRWL